MEEEVAFEKPIKHFDQIKQGHEVLHKEVAFVQFRPYTRV
jgi:hypothetical protein